MEEDTEKLEPAPETELPEPGGGQDPDGTRWAAWEQEAQTLREDYPELELTREAEHAPFLALLEAGVSVRVAYEAVHLEEIKARVARDAALERERALTWHIRARGARPPENGVTAQGGLRARVDVSCMTREQRAEVARRAMRGERVVL